MPLAKPPSLRKNFKFDVASSFLQNKGRDDSQHESSHVIVGWGDTRGNTGSSQGNVEVNALHDDWILILDNTW